MPALAQERLYTIDDIYALPNGERAELIDGQIYYMAPPNRKHQTIARELFTSIDSYIKSNDGSCEPFFAPFAVFLNEDNTNYVEPDICVICDHNKLTDKGCSGAPDWIIEIVSPSNRPVDYYTKLFKYRATGVKEYWIVDYERSLVTVYDFQNDNATNYTFSDDIPASIYPGFCINLSTLNI
ncbi:Uma2 family endonuclease [bacterium 1xD8-6]|nr:Uma2 family endonuclease [bacterium D16-36]RKI64537.1 Uma2 family endonuclease [bacterium 1xD8-6]